MKLNNTFEIYFLKEVNQTKLKAEVCRQGSYVNEGTSLSISIAEKKRARPEVLMKRKK